jgi:hypothetical protein
MNSMNPEQGTAKQQLVRFPRQFGILTNQNLEKPAP